MPGQGATNDVWLLDTATSAWTPLITGQTAVIWPRFRPDGQRIVWGQMTKSLGAAPPDGAWEILAADLTGTTLGTPTVVASCATGLCEPYGWDPAGQNIIFSMPSSSSWLTNSIWTVPDAPGSTPKMLTQGYAEFAGYDARSSALTATTGRMRSTASGPRWKQRSRRYGQCSSSRSLPVHRPAIGVLEDRRDRLRRFDRRRRDRRIDPR